MIRNTKNNSTNQTSGGTNNVQKISNTQKRKPKGPIKYNIELTKEQRDAKKIMEDNTITLLKGAAGSGKSILSCLVALDMYNKREIEKIIICRPAISREDIGFLPGGADEKLQPYMQPIHNNFYKLESKDKIDKMIKDGTILMIPFSFLRGYTLNNCAIIVDESQNLVHTQTELIIGRLGLGSKMFLTGDSQQIDLKNRKDSGLSFLSTLDGRVNGFKVISLKENYRHPIVKEILDIYKEVND